MTFHAQFRRENPTRNDDAFVALEAKGNGWFAGFKLDAQCRDWWLRFPLRDIALPRGFGLGILEGWETVVLDNDTSKI